MMKGIVSLLLSLLLCQSALAEDTPLSMLHTDGTRIVNASGETLQLLGVNAGGWLVQEGWMNLTNAPSQLEAFAVLDERFGRETRERLFQVYEDNYWKASDFDNIRALGMNVIRLPFAWWNIVDDDGALREDAFVRLDWFVDCCAQRGLYVVLDLHAAPGSQNGNDHSGDITGSHLWEEAHYQDLTQFIWEQVAAHYRGNPTIAAYDLLNEPGGKLNSTGVTQWDFFDRLYRAIRAVDGEHIIMMESCWEPENLPAPERYGWENVIYQYHYYKWNADNDYWAQKLFTDVKLTKLAKVGHPVPSFVGEFTLFQSIDAWEYALEAYTKAGLSWTIWTYKVTGSSTWGLYNVYGDKVDIYTDSAEEIEAKWRDQGLLRRNTPICQVVANAIAGCEVELPADPADLSAVPVQALSFASVTATEGASVQPEGDGFRLTTNTSRDPQEKFNAIALSLQESVDCSSYVFLTFHIRDLQGSNTHKVTLIDADGKCVSTWVDIPSVHKEWTRINVPLSMFDGIDLSRLAEIRIGEWNSGDYLFDRFWLCYGAADGSSALLPAME